MPCKIFYYNKADMHEYVGYTNLDLPLDILFQLNVSNIKPQRGKIWKLRKTFQVCDKNCSPVDSKKSHKVGFFGKARESGYPCLYLPEWVVSYLYLYISNPQRMLASNDLGASGELVSGKSLSSCHNFPAWPLLFVLPTRGVQLQGIVEFALWIIYFKQNYFTTATCSSLFVLPTCGVQLQGIVQMYNLLIKWCISYKTT